MNHEMLSSSECGSVVVEFNNFYDNNFIVLRSVFEDFNEATDGLDNFWLEKAKISHFKTLAFAVKLVLTLFHGQTSVEQEFSISNIVHNNNMKEHTIMAKKYIINHMNSHKLKLHTIEINKDLFKSVKSARSKWELAREEKKQHQKKTDLENQKTFISKNIEQVKEECDSLKKAINIMQSEFVECIKQAELENNMS